MPARIPGASRRAKQKASSQGPVIRFNVAAVLVFLISVAAGLLVTLSQQNPAGILVGLVVGSIFAQSPKIASQWERASTPRRRSLPTRYR